MTFHLSLKSNSYRINDLWWILYKVFYTESPIRTNKKISYYNIPCAFDIETTSFYENGEKRAIMYIWMLSLGGYCIIGRSWEEFDKVLCIISEYLALSDKNRLIIYVHNLAYEFQFMRKRFNWIKVFSLDKRKPVYCVNDYGIEFRCSYLLSGYSLERLGRGLNKYKVNKLVGNLDYSKLRHSKTILTDAELQYCINDVLVVTAYIQERIESDGNITNIPITKTGYVRQYCKRECIGTSKHRNNRYRNRIKNMTLKDDEYLMLRKAFQGGFTHANACYSGKILHNVESWDFTSSYPTVMIAEKFPMQKGEYIIINSIDEFNNTINNYCCVFDVYFENIIASEIYENYLSLSHCRKVINPIINNGRIVSADSLITTITEIDFSIIKRMYKWDSIKIGKCIRYKKDYLPTEFIKSILKLYADKTKLKGIESKAIEYMLSKEMLNSCYGMTVTDICRDEIEYKDDVWSNEKPDIEKSINKYNDAKSRFMFYPWGVWITAYARRNLYTGIVNVGNDYVYSDTDSLKILNGYKHHEYIDKYNLMINQKLKKAMQYHKLDFEYVEPKTINGNKKLLGVWDYEGTYSVFKTLGAKRYMYKENDYIHLTVAGLNKKEGLKYLLFYNNDAKSVFDIFSDEMYIPKGHTGKMLHTYIDDDIKGTLIDYNGFRYEYNELSYIHLENAEYSLSIGKTYADYLLSITENWM